jgi:hypothetical protein
LFAWKKLSEGQSFFGYQLAPWKEIHINAIENGLMGVTEYNSGALIHRTSHMWETIVSINDQDIKQNDGITSLLIENFFDYASREGQKEFFQAIYSTKKLVEEYVYKVFSTLPKNLHSLHFVASRQLKMSLLGVVTKQCPTLKKLEIEIPISLLASEQTIFQFDDLPPASFSHVTHLSIKRLNQHPEILKNLFTQFPNVTHLKIDNPLINRKNNRIDKSLWKMIHNHMKHLENLDLSHSAFTYSKEPPVQLGKLLANINTLPQLRSLTFNSCYGLSIEFDQLVKFPNLESLYLKELKVQIPSNLKEYLPNLKIEI